MRDIAALAERDILGHVKVWPMLPYPHGVTSLIEYRGGNRVIHYVPHTSERDELYTPIAAEFYKRTMPREDQ